MQSTAKVLSHDVSRPPRTVVEVFVPQLSVPPKMAHADGPHRIATVCVNEVFVTQLSVPPMVAQTVEPQRRPTVCATTGGTDSWTTKTSTTHHKQTVVPQRHAQKTTKTSTTNIHITAHATTAAATTTATTTTIKTQS